MTQKAKMQKMQMFDFVQNHKKTEMEIFAFCVHTFEPMRAGFLRKCQNSLWQISPEIMDFQA